MHRVLILDDVHESAKMLLESNDFEVLHFTHHTKELILSNIANIDAIIYRLFTTKLDKDILEKASKLKCIIRTGGGIGNIDYAYALKKNIIIMDTNGCNSFSAAEFIFGSILTLARKIAVGDKLFRSGKYERSSLWSTELANKTLGIIGFGRIGKFVCKMATSFNMNVISYSPHITSKEEKEFSMKGVSLDELYSKSDFISIAFPGTINYLGMINKEKIALMKKGVYLINATSMGLFNYVDVADAIKNGKIGGIVIDRPDFDPIGETNPLLQFPNVLFTPTLGSHTHEGQRRCAIQAINQLIDYLNQGKISNQIII